MPGRCAADLFVECLEAEGVAYVFGIPGEETLDLNRALEDSSVRFVPVRHEQGGAYMADAYGRLTGRAGVCLGTLGPGATNLVTAVADAQLDRAPLVALTGQSGLERMHKESHQFLDLVQILQPVVKWNARVTSPDIVPEVVRKAFKLAEAEKPGATHLELPEDVMAEALAAPGAADGAVAPPPAPLPRGEPVHNEPRARDVLRAAELIRAAERPVVLAGNGVVRGRAAHALRELARATGIGVAQTFMAKGVIDDEAEQALGTVGLQARDYALAGFEEADLVVAVGYDLVEHAPKHWNPRRDKRIVVVDTVPAETDASFVPEVEVIGDIHNALARLTDECRDLDQHGGSPRLRELVQGRFDAAAADDRFPLHPPRALLELRRAMGREDVLISDVGLHKLWIGRMFPAHEPNTVLIANGLAGMGFAVPSAVAAKLVHPRRNVVAVSGDGGFLMNFQELETAVRLRAAFVNVVWENGQYGSIVWKQDKRFGRHFGTDFANPDFVKLAEAFGMPAWRAASAADFRERLAHALTIADVPSLIVLPVDYSADVTLADALGAETVAT
jgi:acetolactate synthase-1/2/3 large subunit